jgi:HD-GYP domain-containing protein (c-di-GMP phosphodiesterase class II)
MATNRPVSLQRFIYRTLTLRLLLMAALIGVCTGAGVYLSERRNLTALVVEETRVEIQMLIARTLQIVKEQGDQQRAAFHQALEERLARAVPSDTGAFVYVNFSQTGSGDSEERIATDYPLIAQVLGFIRSQPQGLPHEGHFAEALTLGERLHIWTVMPLTDPAGPNPAYAQAMFAPSEKTLQGLHQKLRRSVALALFIVALTSGLLYPVIFQLVRKLTLFSRSLLDANLGTLSLLASAIAKRDSDTDVHNFRVTLYAMRLAEAMHLENSALQTLIKGAFLHDVGKIGVRDEILLKPGRLDALEFARMQEHVRYGLDIIAASPWLADASQVVGGHHEKFDGSGYPEGQAGEAIPLGARIFAVVDVFDALTSKRPYKEPLSLAQTLDLLRQGRGSHFDPAIVDTFITIAPELYQAYAGREDQRLKEELKAVMARAFSEGEIMLD